MADDYQQTAFEIVLEQVPEETAWLQETLAALEEYACEDCAREALLEKYPELADTVHAIDMDECVVVQLTITGGTAHFSVDNGSLDVVACYMQAFLIKFQCDESISFSWADTCSKARADHFGGGAAFITATKVTFMNTYDWLAEMQREHVARRKP